MCFRKQVQLVESPKSGPQNPHHEVNFIAAPDQTSSCIFPISCSTGIQVAFSGSLRILFFGQPLLDPGLSSLCNSYPARVSVSLLSLDAATVIALPPRCWSNPSFLIPLYSPALFLINGILPMSLSALPFLSLPSSPTSWRSPSVAGTMSPPSD